MSKASEYRDLDERISVAIGQLQRERAMGRPTFVAAAFAPLPLAQVDDLGRLHLDVRNITYPVLEPAEALKFARWILDTFGELPTPQAEGN